MRQLHSLKSTIDTAAHFCHNVDMEQPPYVRLLMSDSAYTHLVELSKSYGYVRLDSERPKGLGTFITALFNSPTPLASPSPKIPDEWSDTRSQYDPDLLQAIDAVPPDQRDEYRAIHDLRTWERYPQWSPPAWRSDPVDDRKRPRVIKLTTPTLQQIQLLGLHFEIASVNVRNHTFESITDAVASTGPVGPAIASTGSADLEPQRAALAAVLDRILLSQSAAVLEAVGRRYLTPIYFPDNPDRHKISRRYTRTPQRPELAFF